MTIAVYDAGQYDALVQGGGPRGMLEAVRLSRQGKRTALIESRSCLLWQVARAKQGFWPFGTEPSDPLLLSFQEYLGKYRAISDGKLETSYAEIASDQWLLSQSVRVLFQAKLLHRTGDEVTLALKGKVGTMKVKETIDCRETINSAHQVDSGTHPYSIWTLTFRNVPLQRDTFLELAVPGASVSVRLRSGFYPGDTIVDIAFPTQLNERAPIELAFAGSIEAIAKQIRASREAWSRATMVYMCDEPWIPECQEQFCDVSGDRLWEQVSQQFALLFHPYK